MKRYGVLGFLAGIATCVLLLTLVAAKLSPTAPIPDRDTYFPGTESLATDYMVFNVTKDDIRVRMSVVDEEVWPSPPLKKKNPPDTSRAIPFSDFTRSGALGFPEVVGPTYDEINKIYGTNYEPVFKE